MGEEKEELKVTPIENGIVIDHIRAEQVLNVCKILGILSGTKKTGSMAMNVKSKKMVKKGFIKIEGKALNISEIDKIAIISPEATVNIIENYKVTRKAKVKPPKVIRGIIKCPNPNCISNAPREPITSKFLTKGEEGEFSFQCYYCYRIIEPGELTESII